MAGENVENSKGKYLCIDIFGSTSNGTPSAFQKSEQNWLGES